MNTRKLAVLAGFLLIGTTPLHARQFGLGIMLGEPTGISFKNWLDGHRAVAGGVAWAFGGRSAALHLHLDHIWHDYGAFASEKHKEGNLPIDFSIYYGLGARLKLETQNLLGMRIPVGVNYTIPNNPLEFFLEVVPIVDLIPATGLGLNLAIGARYYF